MNSVGTIHLFAFSLMLVACVGRPPGGPSCRVGDGDGQVEVSSLKMADGQSVIIRHEGFLLSFNVRAHIPNWVAYELTSGETGGPYSRKGKDFQPDPGTGASQADADDYRGSGWSRGHMAPAADFKWSDVAMTETFYYTNVCPQDQVLNNRYWNTLENKVRGWANRFGKIYVVTGPVVGADVNGTIGTHEVVVPDAFFKVLLAYDDNQWRSIAFVMENTPDQRLLKDCAVTVNEVERLTQLDFFEFLDDSLEETVESGRDCRAWGVY